MTTFEVRGNPNYAAQVIEVKTLVDLPGLNNLVGLPWAGLMALVPKTTQIGDTLVVFPAEAQLSHEFASANDLYRHSELNSTPDAVGYLEDNRRVRAIRLRGHLSSALAVTPEALALFLNSTEGFGPVLSNEFTPVVGTSFDTINGYEVSRKYELPVKGGNTGKSVQKKAWKRVDAKFLPEHIDTAQYLREADSIPDDTFFTVTQKIHGSSVRIANTIVKHKPKWWERGFLKRPDTEYAHVYGSRKVIKDPSSPGAHFYGYDLWGTEGAKYDDLIPRGVVVYGELVGFTKDGGPIQKDYTYEAKSGEAQLYIYRVAVVSPDGLLFDLSWEGVKSFCAERGLKHVAELWSGFKRDFEPDKWLDRRFYDGGYTNAVRLSHPSLPDEGVVLRAEGVLPRVWKLKGPKFFAHETAMLDEEAVDLEAQG